MFENILSENFLLFNFPSAPQRYLRKILHVFAKYLLGLFLFLSSKTNSYKININNLQKGVKINWKIKSKSNVRSSKEQIFEMFIQCVHELLWSEFSGWKINGVYECPGNIGLQISNFTCLEIWICLLILGALNVTESYLWSVH